MISKFLRRGHSISNCGKSLCSLRSTFGICKRSYASLNNDPEEKVTKVSDINDPQRNPFFQYSWGTWITNDKLEKSKRETKFSIEGLTQLLSEIHREQKESANYDKNENLVLKAPKQLKDGSFLLTNNIGSEVIGESDPSLLVESIASIHEGKHNRIYKLSLSTGKQLVLRIPYKLESDYAISEKIKSEVATSDFLKLKLGLNVPRVVSYGCDKNNCLESPFIILEYIEGELLMRTWEPLAGDEEKSQEKLKFVIGHIANFQERVLSINFNKFGSLYFFNDTNVNDQATLPYDNEENQFLRNRWRIGPSLEKPFTRNKNLLSPKQVQEYNKSIPADRPLDVVSAAASIEIENLRHRLSLAQSDSSNRVEDVQRLEKIIDTFEKFRLLAPQLINPKSNSIMSIDELMKPKLLVPDLDPLNVIMTDQNEPYFIDFENTVIKPFILSHYPKFVAYEGERIFNVEEDIPNYNELDETDKQQVQFMYYKTRNERLWEHALNERRHDLIAIASPYIKVLKAPYSRVLDFKNDKDYLYIEGSLSQLLVLWGAFVQNELCNSDNMEYPIKLSKEEIKQNEEKLKEYQRELASTPFAATGGWVPQDMFENLKQLGILVETENGDFKVDVEKALSE